MAETEATHYAIGPKFFDAACGIEGNFMTPWKNRVTCGDCKAKLDQFSEPSQVHMRPTKGG